MFKNIKHKSKLKKALSDCFEPLKSVLGNVPIPMQTDRFITAAILGTCRAYAESNRVQEKDFNVIVDAVFEELFRRESMAVQLRTESWLQEQDEDFMQAYYHAKSEFKPNLDLSWLATYAQQNFKVAFEVDHLT